MDADAYVRAIASRCVVLLNYYDRPGRIRLDDGEMRYEFRLLEADARRWGLARKLVSLAVLVELQAAHEPEVAHRLHAVFEANFGRTTKI